MKLRFPHLLEDYMQRLNDLGQECVLFVLDAMGNPWLAFGEERSQGGEAMACWVLNADVAGDRNGDWGHECDVCGSPTNGEGVGDCGRRPLNYLSYPIIALNPRDVFAQESQ